MPLGKCGALALCLVCCSAFVLGDVYLHNPRGSNNRLDEQNENRNNNNRLFDSQNNNEGGYNVGSMYYYEGSTIEVEWTNQHSCNTGQNNCEIILQYMCSNQDGTRIRDGTTTNSPTLTTNPTATQVSEARATSQNIQYGLHESFSSFYHCSVRSRMKGLFVSTQNFNANNEQKARNTRQQDNGQQNGWECPEERDYYPYWHYSEWTDIAVLTSDTSRCDYYKANSGNVAPKYNCADPTYNTQAACEGVGSSWVMTEHQSQRMASGNEGAPDCKEPPTTRINHLGNTADGKASTYTWTVPPVVSDHCVFRIRYNISTSDYEAWDSPPENTVENGGNNNALNLALQPVYKDVFVPSSATTYLLTNDPTVDFGATYSFELNVQTDQYGRTFQDRSHVFEILARPDGVKGTIHNINVRGRRGNIVECYPAVEYDFTPNDAKVTPGDWVHFQWTGSNNNPDSAGEGRESTDRSNVVQLENLSYNQAIGDSHMSMLASERLQRFAYVMPYDTKQPQGNTRTLDGQSVWFDGGLFQADDSQIGTYYYMSTRNNNFSNRSQKGTLSIGYFDSASTGLSTLEIILIATFVPLGSCCILIVVAALLAVLWVWQPTAVTLCYSRMKVFVVIAFKKIFRLDYDAYDTEKGLYTLASRPGERADLEFSTSRFEAK